MIMHHHYILRNSVPFVVKHGCFLFNSWLSRLNGRHLECVDLKFWLTCMCWRNWVSGVAPLFFSCRAEMLGASDMVLFSGSGKCEIIKYGVPMYPFYNLDQHAAMVMLSQPEEILQFTSSSFHDYKLFLYFSLQMFNVFFLWFINLRWMQHNIQDL